MKIKTYITLFSFIFCAINLVGMEQNNANFFELAEKCDYQALESVITKENVNLCDNNDCNLLIYSINGAFENENFDDFEKTIAVFKKHGANFHKKGHALQSGINFASMIAVHTQKLKPLEILCKAGANPFFVDVDLQKSPFDMILDLTEKIETHPFAFKVAQALALFSQYTTLLRATKALSVSQVLQRACGSLIKQYEDERQPLLMWAIRYGHLASQEECNNVIKILIKHGASPNVALPSTELHPMPGHTCMHYAVFMATETGSYQVIEALLKNGGSPAEAGYFPRTPLQLAQEYQELGISHAATVYSLYKKHVENQKILKEAAADYPALNTVD